MGTYSTLLTILQLFLTHLFFFIPTNDDRVEEEFLAGSNFDFWFVVAFNNLWWEVVEAHGGGEGVTNRGQVRP